MQLKTGSRSECAIVWGVDRYRLPDAGQSLEPVFVSHSCSNCRATLSCVAQQVVCGRVLECQCDRVAAQLAVVERVAGQ